MSRLVVWLAVLAAGCAASSPVDEAGARALLAEAIMRVANGQLEEVCDLSEVPGGLGTCEQSLVELGERAPSELPRIVCSLPVPSFGPLADGHVLVLEGVDGAGERYRTEFPVWDGGAGTMTLDAVYWSGLRVTAYSEDGLSWGFGDDSTLCDDGALPSG